MSDPVADWLMFVALAVAVFGVATVREMNPRLGDDVIRLGVYGGLLVWILDRPRDAVWWTVLAFGGAWVGLCAVIVFLGTALAVEQNRRSKR